MMKTAGHAYMTHFEMAKKLGVTPARVKHMALKHELGDFGHSGGVLYFPTPGNDNSFFEKLIRVRHGLD